KPADVHVKIMKGQWTEDSSYRAVSSWLRLSTSQQAHIDLIAAQDDAMALGARKAFQDLPDTAARDRWLSIPYTGCDGLPKTGQDRKSTRLNSSHVAISYAVFCL